MHDKTRKALIHISGLEDGKDNKLDTILCWAVLAIVYAGLAWSIWT